MAQSSERLKARIAKVAERIAQLDERKEKLEEDRDELIRAAYAAGARAEDIAIVARFSRVRIYQILKQTRKGK